MNKDQANELWRMVYAPYGKQQKPTTEQAQTMYDYLLAQSYEITKPAIDSATRVCNFPPTIADIERCKAQIAESHRYDAPGPTPVDKAVIAYQDTLIRMPDDEYMALLAQRRRGA
jgi:hypothetical protein